MNKLWITFLVGWIIFASLTVFTLITGTFSLVPFISMWFCLIGIVVSK